MGWHRLRLVNGREIFIRIPIHKGVTFFDWIIWQDDGILIGHFCRWDCIPTICVNGESVCIDRPFRIDIQVL